MKRALGSRADTRRCALQIKSNGRRPACRPATRHAATRPAIIRPARITGCQPAAGRLGVSLGARVLCWGAHRAWSSAAHRAPGLGSMQGWPSRSLSFYNRAQCHKYAPPSTAIRAVFGACSAVTKCVSLKLCFRPAGRVTKPCHQWCYNLAGFNILTLQYGKCTLLLVPQSPLRSRADRCVEFALARSSSRRLGL
jgi:hypothetical protein